MEYFKNETFHPSKFYKLDLKDLFFLDKLPFNIFIKNDDRPQLIKNLGDKLPKEFFLQCYQKEISTIYVVKNEEQLLVEAVYIEIINLGRKISTFTPSEFSKKLIHFMATLQKLIYLFPLHEKLISYQSVAFKIWITFVKKQTNHQLQKLFKNIYNGPYDNKILRSIICATFMFKLVQREQLFTEAYMQNLALSCLFNNIGQALVDKNVISSDEFEAKIQRYSNLILSINTDLMPQNLTMIKNGTKIEEKNVTSSSLTGHETCYYKASNFVVKKIFTNNIDHPFSLKEILTELKKKIGPEFHREYKNVVLSSLEIFGWQ